MHENQNQNNRHNTHLQICQLKMGLYPINSANIECFYENNINHNPLVESI